MPAGKGRTPLLLALGGVVVVAAILVAIVLLRTRLSSYGTVRIESDDPNVEIVFDKTGPTIKGSDKEAITLSAREHSVLIKRGDFAFEAGELVLKKDEAITLELELLQGKVQFVQDGKVIKSLDFPLASKFTNTVGMEFVLVPKGKSWLGGSGGKPGTKEMEVHHDFYLGTYEVTQEEWQKVLGNNPSHFSRTGAGKRAVNDISTADLKRFPVESIAWEDVERFVAVVNDRDKRPGWVYRVPTEVEWEYACRGGPLGDRSASGYDYYFDTPSTEVRPEQANLPRAKGVHRPCKVGSYKPNRLGLYDMHGNVWEWCCNPEDPVRVSRGGGWKPFPNGRAAHRNVGFQPRGHIDLGLRLARVPTGKEVARPTVKEGPYQQLGDTSGLQLSKTEEREDVQSTWPPSEAVVLFDGQDLDRWVNRGNGQLAAWKLVEGGAMQVVGGDIMTREKFDGTFKLHVEFRVPYLPQATGQARGNSGIFLQGRYELQVLDSNGLDSNATDCAAIYGVAKPLVNACKAPTFWQSYDIEFTAPKCRDGKKVEPAVITVYHNGVKVHDKLKINTDMTIGGLPGDGPCTPGPIVLQGHGSAVQFRNIWLLMVK